MASSSNAIFFGFFILAHLTIFTSAKVYVVYMGSSDNEDPYEILTRNHQILSSVHSGSFEEAKASHLYSYKHGFKGFAAKLSDDQALQISKMEGVVSVFENKIRKLHTTHSWDFIGLGEEETMEIPGFSTKGQVDVIIGFIDTGIWPESPSFSDFDMPPVPAKWKGICQSGEAFNATNCNRKLIGARYYHSGYEAERHDKPTETTDDPKTKLSFRSPRDSNGHGSHTASTAAGRYVTMNYKGLAGGGARGGAPMARIAVYKTCWDSGCYDADILAAFDDAVRDGVHIVSLSLGPDAPQGDYFSDAISIGSFHAVSRGITVVSSVGNEGTKGSATNLAPWLITVAASSTDREFTSKLEMGNGVNLKGESLSVYQMKAPARIISASIANRGYFTPYQSSYCLESSLNHTKTKGKVLLCRHAERSTESKLAKGDVVKSAGGVGMILIDETDKDVAIPFKFPAVIVGKRMGNRILSYINSTRKATTRIFASKAKIGSQPAPRVASFSSKGPNALTPEILKPDIAAPGLNILAAWSPAIGKMNFNILSGTSMACPHVTGIVALIKAVHPSWSPSAIKSAIMTTATVFDKKGKPIRVDPESRRGNAFDYGAGFLDPTAVLDPGLIYDSNPTDYKSFLCSIGYNDKMLHPITRNTTTSCKNRPFSTPSALNYPAILVPNLKSTFSVTRTLTNVKKQRQKSTYRAVVSTPLGIKVNVHPRRLVFNKYGQKLNFTVTFKVSSPSQGYVFGYLQWKNRKSRVTTPLVVRVLPSNLGVVV